MKSLSFSDDQDQQTASFHPAKTNQNGMGTKMAELNYMQRSRLNGYRGLKRRNSLIFDAKFERQIHEEELRESAAEHRQKLEEEHEGVNKILSGLNDEGVELIWGTGEEGQTRYAAVLKCKGGTEFISKLVTVFNESNIIVSHMETRGDVNGERNGEWDILVKCSSGKAAFLQAAAALAQDSILQNIQLHEDVEKKTPWFPVTVNDLDFCSRIVTKYNPELDPRHPAFGDKEYIARRQEIVNIAAEYKHGEIIPRIEYTEKEKNTWKAVYEKLHEIYPKTACKEFQRNLAAFEKEANYSADEIPQLEDVNKILRRKTGFQLRPCGGLLSARDFLSSLAFRVFQATQDVIHELLGHVPMFSDPIIAQFSQELGIASLGASDEDIEKLATVYWFMVEFGLCRENGELRACGAGLLSAYGELQHALSDVPAHEPFDPFKTAVQKYQDDDYQPLYFVADSLEDAMAKLRKYSSTIKRPFSLMYDAYTESINRVNGTEDLRPTLVRIQADIAALSSAIQNIH